MQPKPTPTTDSKYLNRRTFITITGAASVSGLAGCNTDTSDGTPTTDSGPSTTTSEGDPARDAITSARTDLEAAVTALNEYDLVENGQPNFALDQINGYQKEVVTDSTVVARGTLEDALGEASGETATQIEMLISVAQYLHSKAGEYLQLIAGQVALFKFRDQFASDDVGLETARQTANDARIFFTRASDRRDEALSHLSEIQNSEMLPQVEGFDPRAEQTEQEVINTVGSQLYPTAVGFRGYTGGLAGGASGTTAYKDGKYDAALEEYQTAKSLMESADDMLKRAEEREAQYHTEYISLFKCQTAGLAEALGYFEDGTQAMINENEQKADDLRQKGEDKFQSVKDSCLNEQTPTESGSSASLLRFNFV